MRTQGLMSTSRGPLAGSARSDHRSTAVMRPPASHRDPGVRLPAVTAARERRQQARAEGERALGGEGRRGRHAAMLPGAQYAQTEMSGTIGAVILAAGEGRRFGGRKQLAEIDGRPMLEHVIERAAEAGLDPVVAVVPVWLTRPARMVDPRIGWVRNPYPERGMSHSLRLGFAALPATVGAAVILLGDQPTMPRAHIAARDRGARRSPARRDPRRRPRGAARARGGEPLRHRPGGGGGRGPAEPAGRAPGVGAAVAIADPALDVDTPADLEALRDR